jgi:hypothetical protein
MKQTKQSKNIPEQKLIKLEDCPYVEIGLMEESILVSNAVLKRIGKPSAISL